MVDVNTELLQAIAELRSEVRSLSDRLARLESPPESAPKPAKAESKPVPAVVESPAPSVPAPPAPEVPEDILLVISAAVAAFLGERAHIKQVRLIASPGWALQGRVFIQASHNITQFSHSLSQ